MVRQRAQERFGQEGAYRVSARVIPQTSLLELTAEAPQPDQAARLANEAVSLLLEEAEHLNRSRLERALALLEGPLAQARAHLDQAIERLQAFTRRGPSVEERQNELNGKLQLLADYKKRLTQLDVTLTFESTKLTQLQAQLAAEPQRLTLKKALSPEASVLGQAARGLGLSLGEPLMSLDDEQLNPVYVDLRRQVATQQAAVAALQAERRKVQTTLDQLSREVQSLTSALVGLQAEQRELTWQVDTARRIYETTVAQYEGQKAALAAQLGESALNLVRQAPIPEQPSRPQPLLNAAVAGLLGLMVSGLGVFFAEFCLCRKRREGPAVSAHTAPEATHWICQSLTAVRLLALVPGFFQIRQGRRDVGLFFLGWLIAALAIAAVLAAYSLPGVFWAAWVVAYALFWATHFLDLKISVERRRRMRSWSSFCFRADPQSSRQRG